MRKTLAGTPGGELYTLALASSAPLPNLAPQVVLTQTADAKWWQDRLAELESDRDAARHEAQTLQQHVRDVEANLERRESSLSQARSEIVHLNASINAMQATRVWQLASTYWRFRDRVRGRASS